MTTKKILQMIPNDDTAMIVLEHDKDYIAVFQTKFASRYDRSKCFLPLLQDEFCEVIDDRTVRYWEREYTLVAYLNKDGFHNSQIVRAFKGFVLKSSGTIVESLHLPNSLKPKKDWRIYAEFSDERF